MPEEPNLTGNWQPPVTDVPAADVDATTPGINHPFATTDRATDPPPQPASVVGLTFGNYELLGELGRGGMGVVFKARQKRTDRLVALKVIHGRIGADEHAKARFVAEAKALARIKHPHIVTVYEVGEESDCPFFTMEFVDGLPLSRRLQEGSAPTPAEAARLLEDLAGAVQAAHDVGVLHRDIKPGNVLFGSDGKARLTDFGLAKHLDQSEGLTQAGSALGTPAYMPPEQASGDLAKLGPTTDVYSLGATLYELLTGQPPFKGETAAKTILRVLKDEVVPPRKFRPNLSPELEAICLKCLEKNPADRYPTAAALADDLARWRSGLSTEARPLSRARRVWRRARRNWRLVGLAAVVLVGTVLAALGGAFWTKPPSLEARAEKIEERLRRGEKVELIGPTGEPRYDYQLWVVGTGSATAARKREFTVVAVDQAFLELVPDVQTDRYRFSAEFQSSSSTKPLSQGGIYFGWRYGIENASGAADRVGVVYCHDDMFTHSQKERSVCIQYGYVLRKPETPFCCGFAPLDSLEFAEQETDPRPWRRIEIDVTPEGITSRWRRAPGEPETDFRPGGVTRQLIDLQIKANRDSRSGVRAKNPGIDLTDSDYNPRGGVGLYVKDAKVYFRNLVIEPLPSQAPK
jgi:serine/threonine-protein kinase